MNVYRLLKEQRLGAHLSQQKDAHKACGNERAEGEPAAPDRAAVHSASRKQPHQRQKRKTCRQEEDQG